MQGGAEAGRGTLPGNRNSPGGQPVSILLFYTFQSNVLASDLVTGAVLPVLQRGQPGNAAAGRIPGRYAGHSAARRNSGCVAIALGLV
ncbi:MAG: hypothetical protein PsegKO_25970 [Pseudohongiellaceae bacterium]